MKEGTERDGERDRTRKREPSLNRGGEPRTKLDEAVHGYEWIHARTHTRAHREREKKRPTAGAYSRDKARRTSAAKREMCKKLHDAQARRDAMTYRPRSPRALTSRSRSESDLEHVNSTPAITRRRADQMARIGRPPASPSSRLAALTRPFIITHTCSGADRRVPRQRRPEKASLRCETPDRNVRTVVAPLLPRVGSPRRVCTSSLRAFFFSSRFLLPSGVPVGSEQSPRTSFSFPSLSGRAVSSVLREYGREPGTSFAAGLAPAEARKWQRVKCTATTSHLVARETRTSCASRGFRCWLCRG